MYSITNSPGMALDLAHAIQDESRRHPATTRRRPTTARPSRRRAPSPWPWVWARRQVVSV
jgi:hypothetical protein